MDEQSLLFSWWNTVYHLKILNFHIHVQYNKSKDQSTEVCICMILLNKKSFFGPTFTFWPTLTNLHGKTVGRVETKILNFLIISIWGFHPFLLLLNFANFLLWKKVKWYQYGFFIISSILDTLANYSVSKRKKILHLKNYGLTNTNWNHRGASETLCWGPWMDGIQSYPGGAHSLRRRQTVKEIISTVSGINKTCAVSYLDRDGPEKGVLSW